MSKDFLDRVKKESPANLKRWKGYAINHIGRLMGCEKEQAELIYLAAQNIDNKIVLNLNPDEFCDFLLEHTVSQSDSEIKRQARNALGISHLYPVWASYTKNPEGDRKFGKISLKLAGLKNYVVFQGDPSRLRDPSRVDYLTDPFEGLFSPEHQNDCRAVASILAMGPAELSAPETALANLNSSQLDFGRCSVVIFDALKPENIEKIYVSSEKDAEQVRATIAQLSKACPVEISNKGIRQKDPFSFREGDNFEEKPSVQQKYFSVGDRVCVKRSVTTASLTSGTIVDISNGAVTVQWDHKARSVMDLSEALMMLIPQPQLQQPNFGDVIYSTPGMDSKTVKLLTAFEVDPVTLYSLASHCLPSSSKSEGWKDLLKKAMKSMGLNGAFQNGYVETDSYFEPKEWFEMRLAGGMRIIIDYSDSKLKIEAGEAEEYVVPSKFPIVLDE